MCLVLLWADNFAFAKTVTQKLTVRVQPNSNECFYFPEITQGKVVTVDYEVSEVFEILGKKIDFAVFKTFR